MTHTQTDVFFYEDGRFEEGYKPGTIRMRMDNGMGGVNVHIMTDDPREQLRQFAGPVPVPDRGAGCPLCGHGEHAGRSPST